MANDLKSWPTKEKQAAALEHFRPFDIELAKAGAPYALLCGFEVTILKYDGRGEGGPIIGVCGNNDRASTWRADGTFSIEDNPRMALVHPPIGYVDEKPVFIGDILIDQTGAEHPARVTMRFATEGAWRWPKPKTERVYPVTRMTSAELDRAWGKEGLRLVANAALRHAIDASQVVTVEDRSRRELAIAREALYRGQESVYFLSGTRFAKDVDLGALIDGIKT